MDIATEAKEITALGAKHSHWAQSLEDEEAELVRVRATLAHTQAAQEIIQLVAQAIQQKAHERLSAVVSSCLATVFDDPYEFKILFERKRGKTEASLRFLRRGLDVDPLNACGGGMVDVAAFALRASCLMLHRPRLNKVLVIDEAFRFVSAQYRENVRRMLEGLSKDLGLQIIQVTHIEELETGKVVELC
jgi:ABC-type molybdenum transport system ATPase subunit/photorepair protein PhrA